MKLLISVMLTSMLVMGCASTSTDGSTSSEVRAERLYDAMPEKYKIPGLVALPRVTVFDINGWAAIDDQSMIITSGASKRYLVVLQTPSTDLRFAQTIAWRNIDSTVRPGFDRIYIGRSSIPIPYPIQAIFELDGREGAKQARAYIESYVEEDTSKIEESAIDS